MHNPLFAVGLMLTFLGVSLMAVCRLGVPRLPGDIVIQNNGLTVYIPIVTSIVISVALTTLFYF